MSVLYFEICLLSIFTERSLCFSFSGHFVNFPMTRYVRVLVCRSVGSSIGLVCRSVCHISKKHEKLRNHAPIGSVFHSFFGNFFYLKKKRRLDRLILRFPPNFVSKTLYWVKVNEEML